MKPSRYIFTAHAVGASFRFTRIETNKNLDLQLPSQGSCSLSVTGGSAKGEAKRFKLPFEAKDKKFMMVSGESASSTCTGVEKKDRVETMAWVQVNGLTVADKRLVIGSINAKMKSVYPLASDELPSFEIDATSAIQDVQIGKVKLKIDLDLGQFRKWKTLAALQEMRDRHAKLFGALAHKLDSDFTVGYYQTTVVKKITLDGAEKDKADIVVNGNMVQWKDLGKIFFGELYVSGRSRRLVMMRAELGSPSDGGGGGGEISTNGSGGN